MAITCSIDSQGIATLTLDMPDRAANVLNDEFYAAYLEILDQLEADERIRGVILISAKKTWVAGADIDTAFEGDDPHTFFQLSQSVKAHFRRLETLGRPVVAALNGSALGGGLELALACHHRIALNDDGIKFGFPEVGLGLLPGGGGVVRTPRLIGLQKGLEWLSQNRKYTPAQALEAGMIDALATDVDDLMQQARQWIEAHPTVQAPWDAVQHYKIPGGAPDHPRIAQMLAVAPAMVRKETRGNYPAPVAILSAMVEGCQVDFETAGRIESRYFAQLAAGRVSKNMISAFWTQLNQIKKGASRPQVVPRQQAGKVGVLGAGMMGHGIAYVTSLAGLEVVLTDATQEQADAGKEKIAAILARRVKRRRLTPDEMEAVLARIMATDVYDRLENCDLIIEAVFEDRAVKADATRKAEVVMDPDGIFASNTSTLPITGLARASVRPEQFIGLHFFSPVEKMQLVEIIVGEQTSEVTLAKAFDYVLAIGKIPIVVNDSRGFYTSRVFGAWTNEALALLAEGNHPQAIEVAALQAGLPVGPLALLDELSLLLVVHIRDQEIADRAAAGEEYVAHPGEAVLDKMLALDRTGRAQGGGFYVYEGRKKQLWPPLVETFVQGQPQASQAEMIDRILFIQSLETVRCLEEGVLQSAADANLGAIFGWGYPACHGGPVQFIRAYGLERFIARAAVLAQQYGDRFRPPQLLVQAHQRADDAASLLVG